MDIASYDVVDACGWEWFCSHSRDKAERFLSNCSAEEVVENGLHIEESYIIEDDEHTDYSSNMPCDNFGMGACSSSCPKFYECN